MPYFIFNSAKLKKKTNYYVSPSATANPSTKFLKKVFIFYFILFNLLHLFAQARQKPSITLEDIFQKGKFAEKKAYSFRWMKDSNYYTDIYYEKNTGSVFIIKYEIKRNVPVDTIFNSQSLPSIQKNYINRIDDYVFNADETKILISTNEEPLYRYSTKATWMVFDIKRNNLQNISGTKKISLATFSPDGDKVAYTRDNDLFFIDIKDLKETRVTDTGLKNAIINGSSDWVYEEEFYLTKAFYWSPDSKKLLFLSFDESDVKEYNMQLWDGLYPTDYRLKYPKAGEKNSIVTAWIYSIDPKSKKKVSIPESYEYLPRAGWANNDSIYFMTLNRLQNKLILYLGGAKDGGSKPLISEESPTFVDIEFSGEVFFLKNNTFLRTSEKDGYKHLYLYDLTGKLLKQLTKGKWEIDKIAGVDERKKIIYFTSTEDSPLQRQLYSVGFDGENKKKLSVGQGTHTIEMSTDCQFYVDTYSNINSPSFISLNKSVNGEEINFLLQLLYYKICHHHKLMVKPIATPH